MFTADDICPHIPQLARRANFLRRNPDDAQDLVQRTILKTLQMLDRITVDLGRFMMRVMFRLHQNWTRRGGGKRNIYYYDSLIISYDAAGLEDLGDMIAMTDSGSGSRQAEESWDLERILGLVEKLPEPYRYALIETAIHGREYVEVAQELNLKVGGLKSRVSDARVMLRELEAGGQLRRRASKYSPAGVQVAA